MTFENKIFFHGIFITKNKNCLELQSYTYLHTSFLNMHNWILESIPRLIFSLYPSMKSLKKFNQSTASSHNFSYHRKKQFFKNYIHLFSEFKNNTAEWYLITSQYVFFLLLIISLKMCTEKFKLNWPWAKLISSFLSIKHIIYTKFTMKSENFLRLKFNYSDFETVYEAVNLNLGCEVPLKDFERLELMQRISISWFEINVMSRIYLEIM